MTLTEVLAGLGVYAAFLALLLTFYWLYGVVGDRLHARRIVRAFDDYLKTLPSSTSPGRTQKHD